MASAPLKRGRSMPRGQRRARVQAPGGDPGLVPSGSRAAGGAGATDPQSACAFCEIIAGRTPAHVVWEDADAVAFLDRRPLFPGHVLVAPREHLSTLLDLPDARLEPFFRTVRRVVRAVEIVTQADGSFVAVNNRVSQSVPHLHVHVVPRRRHDGLRGFFWPRRAYPSEEEAGRMAATLHAALASEGPPMAVRPA